MSVKQRIVTNLWFNDNAADAVNYYCSIFNNSQILQTTYYGSAGQETHKRPEGSIMTIEFELDGERYVALNGGPVFKFNEAVSLIVYCENQEEIDYYWERLSAGGNLKDQQCGWLKDKFGLSWQVIPVEILEMNQDPDKEKRNRLMNALLSMKKLDILKLRKAFEGL